MRHAPDARTSYDRQGVVMPSHATAPRHRSVSDSFDGEQWDFFALRRLPNRSWGVLHTHLAPYDEELDPCEDELLAGMPTRTRGHLEAARRAAADFDRAAMSESSGAASPGHAESHVTSSRSGPRKTQPR
jgi:hypothetical protein